jgi:hypothetical protein
MTRTRRGGLAAVAVATVVMAFASSAHGAASWSEGPVERSYIQNCVSYSFPVPYVEEGAWTWTGQYLDPANPPDVGQVFYVNVVAGAVGNACAGQHVHFEILGLPVSGMATAVNPATTPIICWAIDWNTNPASAQQEPQWPTGHCPLFPAAPVFNTNAASFDQQVDNAGNETTWPLPQGRGWEIQIPVTVNHPLNGGFGNCNDCNRFDTWIIDGNSSPQLIPHQGLFVSNTVAGGGGAPGGTVGGTTVGLTANPQKPSPAAAAPPKKCKKHKHHAASAKKHCKKKK